MIDGDRAAAWDDGTQQVGPLRDVDVRLPRSGELYAITQPDDLDRLLDAAADDPEQNLPYWSEIWPSGIALADEIVADPSVLRGKRALEIGCGLGVTAIAAIRAGAELSVTDYAPAALELCRRNCRVNAGREPVSAVAFNWRRPHNAFHMLVDAGFPVVLAADVLYESRDVEPLLELVDWVVAPRGMLWLAEPGRAVATLFVQTARSRGWHFDDSRHSGPWPDPKDEGVVVRVYRLRRER
jgi:predicted nicotinamide N-methyase